MNHRKYKLVFDVNNNKAIIIGGENGPVTLDIPEIPKEAIPQDKQVTLTVPVQITDSDTNNLTKLPNYGKPISSDLSKEPQDKALIDIENLKNVSGEKRVEIPNRSGYKKFMNWAFRSFKVVLGAAALVVSFGAAGDTLTDTSFLIIDVVFLVSNIATLLIFSPQEQSASKWIKDIYYLEWKGDPELVRTDMNIIFDEVEVNPNASELYGLICEKYLTVLDSFAAMFGSLVSAMIPADAGATRIIVELIISEGMVFLGKAPFAALSFIYNTIPLVLQEILKTQKALSKFFLEMLGYLKGLLPNENDTNWQRAKKHFARGGITHAACLLIPGCPLIMPAILAGNILVESNLVSGEVSKFLDSFIAPNCDSYAAVIMRIIPLVYATTLIFSRCNSVSENTQVNPVNQQAGMAKTINKLRKHKSDIPVLNEERCKLQYGGMSEAIRKKINLYNVLKINKDSKVIPNKKDGSLLEKIAFEVLSDNKQRELYDSALTIDNPQNWFPKKID